MKKSDFITTNTALKHIKAVLSQRTPQPIFPWFSSSVMILLFSIDNQLHMLFTKRAAHLTRQPSDISFPGGRKEHTETPLETALRETQEELGLSSEDIIVLGSTDFMLTATGTFISPFVGYVPNKTPQELPFSTHEVAQVFTVPLSFFYETKPEIHYLYLVPTPEETFPYERIAGGKQYPFARAKIPELFFQYGEHTIWGLTAHIAYHTAQLFLQEVSKCNP